MPLQHRAEDAAFQEFRIKVLILCREDIHHRIQIDHAPPVQEFVHRFLHFIHAPDLFLGLFRQGFQHLERQRIHSELFFRPYGKPHAYQLIERRQSLKKAGDMVDGIITVFLFPHDREPAHLLDSLESQLHLEFLR